MPIVAIDNKVVLARLLLMCVFLCCTFSALLVMKENGKGNPRSQIREGGGGGEPVTDIWSHFPH